MYRDTYRIVRQILWYVSYREVTVSLQPTGDIQVHCNVPIQRAKDYALIKRKRVSSMTIEKAGLDTEIFAASGNRTWDP